VKLIPEMVVTESNFFSFHRFSFSSPEKVFILCSRNECEMYFCCLFEENKINHGVTGYLSSDEKKYLETSVCSNHKDLMG